MSAGPHAEGLPGQFQALPQPPVMAAPRQSVEPPDDELRHPEDLGVSLDARGLRPYVTERDDDVVLVITDGDIEVEIGPGAGDSWEMAIFGAERLAAAATQYAQSLKWRDTPGARRSVSREPRR